MFTIGFTKTATKAKPAVKVEPKKRPDPNSRPQLLYPCVPENFDGWPDKTAAKLGLGTPKTTLSGSDLKGSIRSTTRKIAPPGQPFLQMKKLGKPLNTFAKPPQLGVVKANPIGKPILPRPKNPIYTPVKSLKDEFGKISELPGSTPMPTKVASKNTSKKMQPLFGGLVINPIKGADIKKYVQPQMATEPLGATMPNQATGGGITGGYGSN